MNECPHTMISWMSSPLNLTLRKKEHEEYRNCEACESDSSATGSEYVMADHFMEVHLCGNCVLDFAKELAPLATVDRQHLDLVLRARQEAIDRRVHERERRQRLHGGVR